MRSRCLLALVALAGATLLSPSTASAWGPEGHRIIGEIAAHFLTPPAEIEVERLLEPGRFDSLAEVGNWADQYARQYETYDWAAKLHSVNLDPAATSFDAARDCPRGECVVGAIERFAERLRDPSLSPGERREAFRFLVHFIEDVHQPLHVVHPDMRGGNRITVTFLGEEMDLHELWDSGLIEHRLETLERDPAARPWRWLAYELRLAIEPAERIAWGAETDPAQWADEGIPPARALTFDIQDGQQIDLSYYEAAIPVVERRLQMAAVRLAAVLNRLFEEV